MKYLFYILMLLLPNYIFAQGTLEKSALDYNWQYIGNPRFSTDTIFYPSLGVTSFDIPYVAFQEYTYSKAISVMNFNGNSWVYTGQPGFSQGKIYSTSLAIGPSNQPFSAYEDEGSALKSVVKKFNGTDWINVGLSGFTTNQVMATNLAFSPSGIPYVSFVDGITLKANVMKYISNAWVNVGAGDFSPMTFAANLAFSNSGDLFVAIQDIQNYQRISIMKYDGTNWNMFGPAGPHLPDYLFNIGLGIGVDGFPYVPIKDIENGDKLTVIKNDGANWITVGSPGFSLGQFDNDACCIAINTVGTPFVACNDYGYPNNIAVWSFNGSDWILVGTPGFSDTFVFQISLAISPTGKPFIAFTGGNPLKLSVMRYDYPIGIKEVQNDQLIIYPNPATDNITLTLPEKSTDGNTIEIYNATGTRLYMVQAKENKIELNVGNYPPGIYIIKVTSDNKTWSGRFCKI